MSAILTPSLLRQQPYGGLVPNGETFPFVQAMQNTERNIPGTNLQFKILTDPDDIEEAFRLRYEIFCKGMNTTDPEKCIDGLESDDYDIRCLHTAITEDDRIIAYARLVLPCEKFPMEWTNFLPDIFDRSQTIEVSRGFVVKDKCGPGNIFWHLTNNVYNLCQEDDIDAILSFSTTLVYNGYKKRGMPFRYVGNSVNFHGHTGHPLIIDVNQHETPNFLLH